MGNWRTDAEYTDAYINKHFAFMFINSYAALIYICFIQDNIGDPCLDYGVTACIDLAAKQLATLIGTNIIVAQISLLATMPCSMGYLRVRIPLLDWASSPT